MGLFSLRRLADLDRSWDRFADGGSPDGDVDPGMAEAIRLVHQSVASPAPDPTFRSALLEDLMHTHALAPTPPARHPLPTIRLSTPAPRRATPMRISSRLSRGAIATAALLVLMAAAAVAALIASTGGGGDDRPAMFPAAQPAATAQAGEPVTVAVLPCEAEPRTLDEVIALLQGPSEGGALAVPTPFVPDLAVAGMGQGLPDGPVPDEETVSAVVAAWGEYWGCVYADDPLRAAALRSDAGVQRGYFPGGAASIAAIMYLDREPDPDRFDIAPGDPVPGALLGFRTMDGGRVGAQVSSSNDGVASGYVVFVWDGSRWLVDDLVAFRG